MIKRGAGIGIGTVLLVIGLGGLALLQTGVIYQPESIQPVSLNEAKPPGPESARAPQPETPAPSPDVGAPQNAIPVPQLGGGERRYPAQDRLEQLRRALKESEGSGVQKHTARKGDTKSHARKEQSGTHARRADSKSPAYKAKSRSYARKAHPASGMKPVVITFRFDPARDRELYVARVHSGDKIKMNVKRVGMADGRVYLTYTKNPDSVEGALVKVGTERPVYRSVGYYPERGYYVIQMKIYPGKRWNIKPRSFV